MRLKTSRKMNAELKNAFTKLKPVCDYVMLRPSPGSINNFLAKVADQPKEILQELQQYVLFPFITHIKSVEIEKQYFLQLLMVDAMTMILEKVSVNNYEMFMKIVTGLLDLVFDKSKRGMVAETPEELKLSTMKCLTVLVCNIPKSYREKFVKTQVPLIAQLAFVAVHIAKFEKLRSLRLAAIDCVMAYTVTHPKFTDEHGHLLDLDIESAVANMLACILPGLLAALQDVATCRDNPGHSVIVAALKAMHRVVCIPMNDKHLKKQTNVTIEDFAKMFKEKKLKQQEVKTEEKKPKDLAKRSPEWYAMAGEKLAVITSSIVGLRTHDHYKVRRELAVYCSRLLFECNSSMQPSISLALDVLISMCKDEHQSVAQYCSEAVDTYLASAPPHAFQRTLDTLADNLFTALTSLPRILNDIDSARKLSALDMVHGYLVSLCARGGGALPSALGGAGRVRALSAALLEAARLQHAHAHTAHRVTLDVSTSPPSGSPWARLQHLCAGGAARLRALCGVLGAAPHAEMLLDTMLDSLRQVPQPELIYILNYIGEGPHSSTRLVKRILDAYLEESLWYLSLEVWNEDIALAEEDTLDKSVYNPRAWSKESVPDLYEGTVEVRYTDISYKTPRQPLKMDPNYCATLAEAHKNMLMSCLLTEGVGLLAKRLMDEYQPYLLKTLCLILERIGSKYEMLHLAGLKAINDIAYACGHSSVKELICCNSDYFTHQITVKLKKAWDTASALEILSVVMEYSDSSILDCLHGIVQDVLLQSCDKYYQKNLTAYLQVFLTYMECVQKWFPEQEVTTAECQTKVDIISEVVQFIEGQKELERVMSIEESKHAEEMYEEDLREREENMLNYDDRVTKETPPLPQHIKDTVTILRRCVNFVPSKRSDEAILAIQVLNKGLPLLKNYEDELLPIVHLSWAPLVASFERKDPIVMRRAFDLLVTLAMVSKDFIRSRAVKDVLPHIYSYLHQSVDGSRLKDARSVYRSSHAYLLQVAALAALGPLAVQLQLDLPELELAMRAADGYLSRKQPKPLQALAVNFYRVLLEYDHGAAWDHLRGLCANAQVAEPPGTCPLDLRPTTGTPHQTEDEDINSNIQLIFRNVNDD